MIALTRPPPHTHHTHSSCRPAPPHTQTLCAHTHPRAQGAPGSSSSSRAPRGVPWTCTLCLGPRRGGMATAVTGRGGGDWWHRVCQPPRPPRGGGHPRGRGGQLAPPRCGHPRRQVVSAGVGWGVGGSLPAADGAAAAAARAWPPTCSTPSTPPTHSRHPLPPPTPPPTPPPPPTHPTHPPRVGTEESVVSELGGMDLQALASADLPPAAAAPTEATQAGAAAAPGHQQPCRQEQQAAAVPPSPALSAA